MPVEYLDFDKLIQVAKRLTVEGCGIKNRHVQGDSGPVGRIGDFVYQITCVEMGEAPCVGHTGKDICPKRIPTKKLTEIFEGTQKVT